MIGFGDAVAPRVVRVGAAASLLHTDGASDADADTQGPPRSSQTATSSWLLLGLVVVALVVVVALATKGR